MKKIIISLLSASLVFATEQNGATGASGTSLEDVPLGLSRSQTFGQNGVKSSFVVERNSDGSIAGVRLPTDKETEETERRQAARLAAFESEKKTGNN